MSTLTSEQQELRDAKDLRDMLHQRYGYYKPGSLLEAVDRAISDYIMCLSGEQESHGRMPLRRLGELYETGRFIELPVPLGTTVYHTEADARILNLYRDEEISFNKKSLPLN